MQQQSLISCPVLAGDTEAESGQDAKQLGRRILVGVRAFLQFLGSDTKLYNRIY